MLTLVSLFDINFVDRVAPVCEVCPSEVRPGLRQQSRRWIAPLYRCLHGQVPHAHEIVGGDGKGENPESLMAYSKVRQAPELNRPMPPRKDALLQ